MPGSMPLSGRLPGKLLFAEYRLTAVLSTKCYPLNMHAYVAKVSRLCTRGSSHLADIDSCACSSQPVGSPNRPGGIRFSNFDASLTWRPLPDRVGLTGSKHCT